MFVRWIRATFSIVVSLAFFGPSVSRAGVFAEDTLSYPDGALYGMEGGSGWEAHWNGFATNVISGEGVGLSSVEFLAVRSFPQPFVTSEVFVEITIRTPANFGTSRFLGIYLSGGVNNGSLVFGKPAGDNRFIVGNNGYAFSEITADPNTTYRLIGVTDLDQSRVSLWVNPDAGDYYDPATGESSADVTTLINIAGLMDRLSVYGNETGTAFDDIVLGDTPESVGLLSSSPTGAGEILAGASGTEAAGGWATSAPNPCRDATRLSFNLPVGGAASLAMFDVNGRLVEETALGIRAAGVSEHVWNAAGAPSGVYFYEVRVDGAPTTLAGKLIVAR